MARLQHLSIPVLYVALVAGGVVAGAVGAALHVAVESLVDWARGRRT